MATTRLNYTRNETDNFTGYAGSQTFVLGRVESNFENFVNEGWAAAQSITSLLGNASVNEFRFSYSQEVRPRRERAPGPETAITDTGNFGQIFFLPIDSQHKRYQVIDSFSRTFGKHDLKLGGDLNSNASNQTFIGFAGGVYTFFSPEDFVARTPAFLLQRVGINGVSVVESGTLRDFWQHELSFYVQDNWRVHPDFNLNLGLRWDGVWNPSSNFGLPESTLPVGKPRISGNRVSVDVAPASSDVPNDFNNFAPRVGFAWDVGGRHSTIVRGGGGIYYAATPTIFVAGMLSGPGLRSAVVFVPFFGSRTDLLGFGLSYPGLLPSTATPEVESLIGPPSHRLRGSQLSERPCDQRPGRNRTADRRRPEHHRHLYLQPVGQSADRRFLLHALGPQPGPVRRDSGRVRPHGGGIQPSAPGSERRQRQRHRQLRRGRVSRLDRPVEEGFPKIAPSSE